MNLIALHGFLGQAQDFKPLVDSLNPEWALVPDLFGEDLNFLGSDFENFTRQILERVSDEKVEGPIDLVGYSLGGRLALHLVIAKPELFGKVILLSTHPGVSAPEEVQKNRHTEDEWVQKIVGGPWENFVDAWMAQPVFKNDEKRNPEEENFDEKTLIKALTAFSKTRHHFTQEQLLQLKHPLTWVCGEKDEKYRRLAQETAEKRRGLDEVIVLPGKGHRLIADKDLSWLSALFSS